MALKRSCKILVFSLLLVYLVMSFSEGSVTVPASKYFGIPALGTYISFGSEQTFSEISRVSSYWYFDGFGVQVENGNLSITEWLTVDDKIVFTVTAPSGNTSTTRIYAGTWGRPWEVDGATTWSYSMGSRVVVINVLHSSSEEVTVDWRVPRRMADIAATGYIAISLTSLGFVILIAIAIIQGDSRTMWISVIMGTAVIISLFVVMFIIQAISNI